MSGRYPSDPRNINGFECLSKLAIDAAELCDGDWLQLQPYCELASEPWREAISTAARHVGFTRKIKDFHTFVEHLIEVLNTPVMA